MMPMRMTLSSARSEHDDKTSAIAAMSVRKMVMRGIVLHLTRAACACAPLHLQIANRNSKIPRMPVNLESIRAARARIKDVIYHSACNYSLSLSRLCNARIHCKLDHLQVTGSFKERGARNKLKL